MTAFIAGLDMDSFLAEYWQTKPLFLKGGATALLAPPLTYQAADEIVRQAKHDRPASVASDPGRIDFVRGAELYSPRLDRLAAAAREAMRWSVVGFDLSRTYADGSIGCHFDYNDNFTLQQEGTKRWWVGRPEMVPAEDRRRRILQVPDMSGEFYIPEGYEEYLLEPGDLLYIPMFAPHWGTSHGESLSLSMVWGPMTGLTELLPLLEQELGREEAWWRPLDTGGEPTEQVVARLLDRLTSPGLRQRLARRWDAARHGDPRAPQTVAAAAPAPVVVDVTPIRPLFDTRHQPDLAHAVLPQAGDNTIAALDDLVGLRYLKRLLILARDRANRSVELAAPTQALLDGLVALPHDVLLGLCRRPEVTSWVWQAEREHTAGYRRTPDVLLPYLALFALPDLLRHRVLPTGASLLLPVDEQGDLPLLAAAQVVQVGAAPRETVAIQVGADVVQVTSAGGVLRMSVPAVLGAAADPRVRPVPRVLDGPVAVGAHPWYSDFLPKNTPLPVPLDPAALHSFAAAVAGGLRTVDTHWQPAGQVVRRVLTQVMPLQDKGNEPWNHSVHGFRGLMLTSARRPYLMAQSLCHEAAHNRFSTIVDLYPLATNPEAVVYSPFVFDSRPLVSLLHGIFAFLNDITMAVHCDDGSHDEAGPSITRYTERLHDQLARAMETLRATMHPTPRGEQLLAGLSATFAQVTAGLRQAANRR